MEFIHCTQVIFVSSWIYRWAWVCRRFHTPMWMLSYSWRWRQFGIYIWGVRGYQIETMEKMVYHTRGVVVTCHKAPALKLGGGFHTWGEHDQHADHIRISSLEHHGSTYTTKGRQHCQACVRSLTFLDGRVKYPPIQVVQSGPVLSLADTEKDIVTLVVTNGLKALLGHLQAQRVYQEWYNWSMLWQGHIITSHCDKFLKSDRRTLISVRPESYGLQQNRREDNTWVYFPTVVSGHRTHAKEIFYFLQSELGFPTKI